MPKFDERFARQYRYELPPGFPLASPKWGIGHHLSGLNKYAQARTSRVGRCCIDIHSFRFHCAYEFNTLTLAHLFNSLVRVSRRVVYTVPLSTTYGKPVRVTPALNEQLPEANSRKYPTIGKWCRVVDQSSKIETFESRLHLGHGQSLPPWRFQVF